MGPAYLSLFALIAVDLSGAFSCASLALGLSASLDIDVGFAHLRYARVDRRVLLCVRSLVIVEENERERAKMGAVIVESISCKRRKSTVILTQFADSLYLLSFSRSSYYFFLGIDSSAAIVYQPIFDEVSLKKSSTQANAP